MGKQTVKLIDFEDKESQAGKPYTRFNTSDGWMSCFEKGLIVKLKEVMNQDIVIDMRESEDGAFKNIRGYFPKEKVKVVKVGVPQETKVSGKYDPTTMYVSYAKDILVAMINRTQAGSIDSESMMEVAIGLVKQAREAFS